MNRRRHRPMVLEPESAAPAAPGLPQAIDITTGVRQFILWLGGSMAGITALLYACGYLVTRAHLHMLGLYGFVEFGHDHFVQEGSKFLAVTAASLDQTLRRLATTILTSPVLMLLVAIVVAAVMIRRTRNERLGKVRDRLRTFIGYARYIAYPGLLLLAAAAIHECLTQANLALGVHDLLYATRATGACASAGNDLGAALMCNDEATLEAAFHLQLLFTLLLMAVAGFAWHTVMPWRNRMWMILPFLLSVALSLLLLPMVYGAVMRPRNYPLLGIVQEKTQAASTSQRLYLISQSSSEFVIWDKQARKVIWLPPSTISRAEISGIAPLFDEAED